MAQKVDLFCILCRVKQPLILGRNCCSCGKTLITATREKIQNSRMPTPVDRVAYQRYLEGMEPSKL